MNVLLLYGTKKGSTTDVANFIADHFRQNGLEVDVVNADGFTGTSESYDAYVLGSAVYTGLWLPQMLKAINRILPQIGERPVFCWVSCIRVLEPEGYQYVKQNYLPNELSEIKNLNDLAVFAGRLDMNEVDFEERWTLAVRYDGRSNPVELSGDFRDWDTIRAWALQVALKLKSKE